MWDPWHLRPPFPPSSLKELSAFDKVSESHGKQVCGSLAFGFLLLSAPGTNVHHLHSSLWCTVAGCQGRAGTGKNRQAGQVLGGQSTTEAIVVGDTLPS